VTDPRTGENLSKGTLAGIRPGTARLFDCGEFDGAYAVARGCRRDKIATQQMALARRGNWQREVGHTWAEPKIFGENGNPVVGDGLSTPRGEAGADGVRMFGCGSWGDWRGDKVSIAWGYSEFAGSRMSTRLDTILLKGLARAAVP